MAVSHPPRAGDSKPSTISWNKALDVEGPFVNSPNAWLRLRCAPTAFPAPPPPTLLYDIAGLD